MAQFLKWRRPDSSLASLGVFGLVFAILTLYMRASDEKTTEVQLEDQDFDKQADASRTDLAAKPRLQTEPNSDAGHGRCVPLERALAAGKTMMAEPHSYRTMLDTAMQNIGATAHCSDRHVFKLHCLLAEATEFMKDYSAAVVHRQACLNHIRRLGGRQADEISNLAALATNYYLNFEYEAAFASLRAVRSVTSLPAAVERVLLQLESTVYECSGDSLSSLLQMERSFRLSESPPSLAEQRLHIDLLKRVLKEQKDVMPMSVRKSMAARLNDVTSSVLQQGPWLRGDQLPRQYIPHLHAAPWHEVSGFEVVTRARALLMAASTSLRVEYQSLLKAGLLVRDCTRSCSFFSSCSFAMRS